MSNTTGGNADSAPLLIRDLLRWAGVRELAEQAIAPDFDYGALGIYITTETRIPWPDTSLPNGFRYPTSAPQPTPFNNGVINFIPLVVYAEVVSRYRGPDPTKTPEFGQLRLQAWEEGGDLDVACVQRLVAKMCQRLKLTNPEEAESLPVAELIAPALGKRVADGPTDSTLSPALHLAYLHYTQAVKALGDDATIPALFEWCQEEGHDMTQWGKVDSWRTAVNRAHEKLGLPKPSARGGVTSPSAVPLSHFGDRAKAE